MLTLSLSAAAIAESLKTSTTVFRTIPPDTPRVVPFVTLVYLFVQLVVLIVCISDQGGVADIKSNPLIGAGARVLHNTGAIWPPDVVGGHAHLLLTSLCVPVGVLRFVADAAVLVVVGVPVERTHGSRVLVVALLGTSRVNEGEEGTPTILQQY